MANSCSKPIRQGWLCTLDEGHEGECVSTSILPQLNQLHTCHAKGCTVPVFPRLLMCYYHWNMVPPDIQSAVWRHYRRGQEIDKRPSREYLEVMKLAIDAVAAREGK